MNIKITSYNERDTAELTQQELHQKDLERLEKMRPLDDDFMRELFRNNIPLAQLVLRIMTGKNDLVITSEETQYDLKHLLGARSICLDVFAEQGLLQLEQRPKAMRIELCAAGRKVDLEKSPILIHLKKQKAGT